MELSILIAVIGLFMLFRWNRRRRWLPPFKPNRQRRPSTNAKRSKPLRWLSLNLF